MKLINVYPAIYLLKVNKRSTRAKFEICSKLAIKIPERRHWPLASFWHLYCQFWTYFTPCSSVSIVNFEHVKAGCVETRRLYYIITCCFFLWMLRLNIIKVKSNFGKENRSWKKDRGEKVNKKRWKVKSSLYNTDAYFRT